MDKTIFNDNTKKKNVNLVPKMKLLKKLLLCNVEFYFLNNEDCEAILLLWEIFLDAIDCCITCNRHVEALLFA